MFAKIANYLLLINFNSFLKKIRPQCGIVKLRCSLHSLTRSSLPHRSLRKQLRICLKGWPAAITREQARGGSPSGSRYYRGSSSSDKRSGNTEQS